MLSAEQRPRVQMAAAPEISPPPAGFVPTELRPSLAQGLLFPPRLGAGPTIPTCALQGYAQTPQTEGWTLPQTAPLQTQLQGEPPYP